MERNTKVLNAGNSLSVTIPKVFTEILKLKKGTPLKLELKGSKIIITKGDE